MAVIMPEVDTLLSIAREKQMPTPEPRLILSLLPAEILLNISDCLPLSSAVSLNICCRKFLWLLGDKALRCLKVKGQAQEKMLFLAIMSGLATLLSLYSIPSCVTRRWAYKYFVVAR